MPKMFPMIEAVAVFAQSAASASPQATPAQVITGFLPIILMVVGFWFLMIAPQRKKQKEHDKMMSALASGDEIITTGGIYGTIANVKDDRFVVRIADNTKIEVGKAFVQSVVKKGT